MERVLNQVLIALIVLAAMLWLFQSSDTCKNMVGKAKSAMAAPEAELPGPGGALASGGDDYSKSDPGQSSTFESGWETVDNSKKTAQAKPPAPEYENEFTPKGEVAISQEGALSYLLVTGSYATREQASDAVLALRKQGYKYAWLTKTQEGRFRVQAGAFTQATAKQVLRELRKEIPDAYLKQAE